MKLVKLLAYMLCGTLLLGFAACTTPPTPETTTTEQDSEQPTTSPDPDVPVDTPKDAIEAVKEELEAIKQGIGATGDTVLYVKDFGAVGDGVTDDGNAIFQAVTAAADAKATLKFEQDKTYYVASVPGGRTTPFTLSGVHDVTIDGCGSTILIAPDMRYANITDSGNLKITNLHFDYAVSVYLVGTVTSVDGLDVTFSVDQNPYQDSYDFSRINGFSIMYNDGTQQRPHMFMSKAVKTADKELTVTYTSGHHYSVGNVVYLPNPGVGHAYSEVFYISGSDQPILFENIGVHAASSFVWAIKGNNAHLFFENVDLVPAENNDREIQMVAWRDGYHCKDNTYGLHWNNCEAGVLFDDVFNIAATLGTVTAVDSNTTFTVKNREVSAAAFVCKPGDTVDIYDLSTGLYKGNGRVRSVISNADGSRTISLYYGQTIEGVNEGCVVANRNTGAPGSTITNCHFTGTFRFLRSLYVENTVFDMLITWMMVEGSVEGPMPGNVDFVNCTFNGGGIQIDAYNRNTSKRMREIGKQIKDIGFWGCTFNDGSEVSTNTKAEYTISDTYTTEDLFTVKNGAVTDPQIISPTESDLAMGVTYDWTLFTMPMTGDLASITPLSSLDGALSSVLDADLVGENVLTLQAAANQKLYLDGLSASALPSMYQKGNSHIIKLTYYTATPVKAKLVMDDQVLSDNLFETTGALTTVTLLLKAGGAGKIAYIEFEGEGTVYLGELNVAAFVNANPSVSQLESGHTFVWDDEVVIEGGQAIKVSEIKDETAKQAIAGAPDKFGSTVLHLDGDMGVFTGLTKKSYFTAGVTYRISIDAYIASPISDGSTMYLLAMDDTPGNRVLKEGIFKGEGLYHFELDWLVGATGEKELKFFINNTPASYADIYVGNFTITKMPGMSPNKTIIPDSMTEVTKEQLQAGFTFDFANGIFLDTGKNTYVDTSCLNAYTAETLAEAGFGQYAYYFAENFHAIGLDDPVYGGNKYTITMKVYDCQGNLDDNARGAFVLLNMTGGGQNSAECNYKITADPNVPGLYTLTFTDNVPSGTDDLLFYQIEPCEFYIASVTVKIG